MPKFGLSENCQKLLKKKFWSKNVKFVAENPYSGES